MLLLPAFHKRKKNAASVGRLVAGYGEIEFLLSWCAGTALACRTPIKPGMSKGEHRAHYKHEGIAQLYGKRGESARIDFAKDAMRSVIVRHDLDAEFSDAIMLVQLCLKIRNLFAHCNWDQSSKRGLFFVSLEDAAKQRSPLGFKTRHAGTKSLEIAEEYFTSTITILNYISQAMAFRGQVAIGPEFTKPKRVRGLKSDIKLFPYKSPR
jgi:hypothetical protein